MISTKKDRLIREAYKEALEWFQKRFNSNFSPLIEIGEYDTASDLFAYSFDSRVIRVNRNKLLNYVELMNEYLKIRGKPPNDVCKEIAARFVHEIVEIFLTTNDGLKYAIQVFPYFHEYADFVEDLYRNENKLEHHAHSYKGSNLEEFFKRIKIENL